MRNAMSLAYGRITVHHHVKIGVVVEAGFANETLFGAYDSWNARSPSPYLLLQLRRRCPIE